MHQVAQGCEGVPALDGKTLRRSYDRAEGKSPLHLVSAWAAEHRLVLGQLAVDGKSNEITAVPKLLEMLALPGMVMTADAMHCRRQRSRQMLDQRANHVLAFQGNQGSLNDDVHLFLDDPDTPLLQATQTNNGKGRVETRTAGTSEAVAWLQERHQWPGLVAMRKITAGRRKGSHASVESRYYLLSQAFSPEWFNYTAREHWGTGTSCTGSWTWCSTRTSPETGRTMAATIWLCCGTVPKPGPAGTLQRLRKRQTQPGRLRQRPPSHNPVPVHQNPNAIALAYNAMAFYMARGLRFYGLFRGSRPLGISAPRDRHPRSRTSAG